MFSAQLYRNPPLGRKSFYSKAYVAPIKGLAKTGKILYLNQHWESCTIVDTGDGYLIKSLFAIYQYDYQLSPEDLSRFVLLPPDFPMMEQIFTNGQVQKLRAHYAKLNSNLEGA